MKQHDDIIQRAFRIYFCLLDKNTNWTARMLAEHHDCHVDTVKNIFAHLRACGINVVCSGHPEYYWHIKKGELVPMNHPEKYFYPAIKWHVALGQAYTDAKSGKRPLDKGGVISVNKIHRQYETIIEKLEKAPIDSVIGVIYKEILESIWFKLTPVLDRAQYRRIVQHLHKSRIYLSGLEIIGIRDRLVSHWVENRPEEMG